MAEASTTATSTVVWLPLVTLVGGYVGSLLTEWFRDKRQRASQREGKREEWAEQADQRRREFQRETLLELQDALLWVVRLTTQLHLADKRAFRETGKWGQRLADEELSEQDRLARARLAALIERVLDEQLRDVLRSVLVCTAEVLINSRSEHQANVAMTDLMLAFQSSNTKLGELLRALY